MSRATWTDERLDDFARNVDRRFDEVDRRFDEVDRRFAAVDRRFDRIEGEIRDLRSEMNAGFRSLQRMMIQIGGGMFATFAVGFIGVIVTQA